MKANASIAPRVNIGMEIDARLRIGERRECRCRVWLSRHAVRYLRMGGRVVRDEV